MRDPSHLQQVKSWATFVREHPTEWKKQHTEFINAQYQKAKEFFARLEQEPGGKEKIKKLRALKMRKRQNVYASEKTA